MWRGLCYTWILIFIFPPTEESHFQGASVTWRPGRIYKEENITEILADFHIAFKRLSTQPNSTYCDDSHIANLALLGDGDDSYSWRCKQGCDVDKGRFDAVCVQYDEEDDWSLGAGTANFNVTGSGNFEIELHGCCWVTNLVYVSNEVEDWSVIISGNVGIRSDTFLPNRSPISTVTPVIRFQAGCPNFVDLLVHDEDGDSIACRSADCPQSSCTFHPYLKLTQQGDKCRLSYNAGGPGDINVAISLILEDYPSKKDLLVDGVLQNSTTKLSSVEMQFIVNVYTDTRACSEKPIWGNGTFANGLIKSVKAGQETKIDLTLHSSAGINSISVVGPEGITQEPTTGPNDDNEYTTHLAFNPTLNQKGDHMVCVTAKDNNGKMSEQRCMVLKVGDKSPCEISNGGCDDLCVSVGESYHCECEQECWQLADDKRTCIPAIEVSCLHDRFKFELPSCAVSRQTVSIGHGYGPSDNVCEATNNGTYYKSEVMYDDCYTKTESDFMEIHYINKVRMWVDPADEGSGDSITRGHYYNMQLICSFNKYANVNASFRPQDREENFVQVPGLGSFQFYFDFYYDDQFGAAYSPYDYPITVTVNSDIYFGIRTVGGTGLEVFTEKCVAMTAQNPTEATKSYTMIENGCLQDETMRAYTTSNTMEDRYSIKAFRFQDSLNVDTYDSIYIQCSAVLCVVGEETRCQKGCIRSRKRRDGEDEIFIDRQKRSIEEDDSERPNNNISESSIIEITVSGPFRIEIERLSSSQLVTVVRPTERPSGENENQVDDEGDDSSGMIIIIASAIGGSFFLILLLIIAILCAYYHLILKSKHKILPDDASTRSSTPSAWSDEHDFMRVDYFQTKIPDTPPPAFWDVQSVR